MLISNGASVRQRSQEFYADIFGPDAITPVHDPDAIAETIAAIIGSEEGRDLGDITDDLKTAAGKEVAWRVGRLVDRCPGVAQAWERRYAASATRVGSLLEALAVLSSPSVSVRSPSLSLQSPDE